MNKFETNFYYFFCQFLSLNNNTVFKYKFINGFILCVVISREVKLVPEPHPEGSKLQKSQLALDPKKFHLEDICDFVKTGVEVIASSYYSKTKQMPIRI